MTWWTVESTLATAAGARALVATLSQVLPDAIPIRWGDYEPYPLNLQVEGLGGLARYIESHHDQLIYGTVSPPFSEFMITNVHPGPATGDPRAPRPVPARSLTIEVDASVLRQAEWRHQLASAFLAIAQHVRPFYAEARIERDVPWGHRTEHLDGTPVKGSPLDRGRTHIPPVDPMRWWGFPRVAPLAMVIGPPYAARWRQPSQTRRGELIVYSSNSWPDPPPDGVPLADDELLQEFDPRRVDPRATPRRSPHPTQLPSVWPFQSPSPSPTERT